MATHPLTEFFVDPLSVALHVFVFNTACFAFWFFFSGALVWRYWFRRSGAAVSRRKVFPEFPPAAQLWREIRNSLLTILIIGLGWVATWYLYWLGYNRIYDDLGARPVVWLAVSVPVTLLLWDAYFYWTHRAMHHPLLFRFFHRTHHRSRHTSPFTGYSFDPAEAVVYTLFLPLVSLVLPLHPLAIGLFMGLQLATNVLIHSGHELLPARFAGSRLSWFLSTATSHAMHHRQSEGNFGFCFQFWDRLMGTCLPDYDARLRETCESRGTAATVS